MSADAENPIRALFIDAFRLRETYSDVWLRHFNAAIQTVGGTRVFAAHEAQLANTHWTMLTGIMIAWMETQNPLALAREGDGFSDAVMTLSALHAALSERYSPTTVRKNFIELKHLGLVEQQGRGDRATVHLHAKAIIAIRETVLEWIRAHAALAERLSNL